MLNKFRNKILFALFLFMILAGGMAWAFWPTPHTQLHKLVLQLPWTHSANYAGFYLARKNGHFSRLGLDVEFSEGGPRQDPLEPVLSAVADIGLINGANLIEARDAGHPVKALACIYRRSPLVYITLASSGITHPREFANRKVRASRQNTSVLKAITAPFNVDYDSITVVASTDVEDLANGIVDIWSGYSAISLQAMKRRGMEVNVIHPENFGVHFYYSCLFTTDAVIKSKPDELTAFLRATLAHGWPDAFRDPEAAAATAREYVSINTQDYQAETIALMLPLVDMGTGDIGWMEPQVWQYMLNTLHKQGVISGSLGVADVFDPSFLTTVFGRTAGPS
jgi:NitT/TauT family transport system substrate-binding protein